LQVWDIEKNIQAFMKKFFLESIVPLIVAPLYYLLYLTWRVEEAGPPEVLQAYWRAKPRRACIYAHWHGDELVLVAFYSYKKLAVLSSLSKDGTIMARVLGILGYQVFRGSSSRGGARGLIGLIKAVKNDGSQAALAVDGPKGPIYEVKAGVVELARKTGQPIVPIRTTCDRAWYIPRAWNRSYVPKPFARVRVEFGPAIDVAAGASLEEITARVKAGLDALPGQT
jgi:lysophospholipid acyltransferase (LPLAT)-like uncharacterized protein